MNTLPIAWSSVVFYQNFRTDAVEFVHRLTGGVPRTINIVCDTLLSYGYLDEVRTIEKEYAVSVMKDRASNGMVALGIGSSE